MSKEAMKLALEALKHGGCPPDCKDGMTDSGGVHPWGEAALIPCPNCRTIDFIREALAEDSSGTEQPAQQQEPVAFVTGYSGGKCTVMPKNPSQIFIVGTAFYTSPQSKPWVELTEEDIAAVLGFNQHTTEATKMTLTCVVEAIEAKLREKNA